MVKLANTLTNSELEHYGIKSADIPPKNVHLVPNGTFILFGENRGLKMKNIEAVTSQFDQGIFIKERTRSKYRFLHLVMHELFHLKSFISVNPIKIKGTEDFTIESRRLGWNIEEVKIGGRSLFNDIDEALIEMLAINTLRKNADFDPAFNISEKLRKALAGHIKTLLERQNDSLTDREKEELEDALRWFEKGALFLPGADEIWAEYERSHDDLVLTEAEDLYTGQMADQVDVFVYLKPRLLLERLIKIIYQRNKQKFNSEDDVFKLFVKGGFDGNIMPVARLVESTFGKGSFRKLGEGIDITQNAGEN